MQEELLFIRDLFEVKQNHIYSNRRTYSGRRASLQNIRSE